MWCRQLGVAILHAQHTWLCKLALKQNALSATVQLLLLWRPSRTGCQFSRLESSFLEPGARVPHAVVGGTCSVAQWNPVDVICRRAVCFLQHLWRIKFWRRCTACICIQRMARGWMARQRFCSMYLGMVHIQVRFGQVPSLLLRLYSCPRATLIFSRAISPLLDIFSASHNAAG